MYAPPFRTENHELYPLTATTATHSTDYKRPPRHVKGVRVYVEATTSSSTPSVVFTIQTKNRYSSTYHTLLTTAAVTGASDNCYEIYPGDALVANVVASRHIGDGFRVTCTHADADSITYRISYEWLF